MSDLRHAVLRPDQLPTHERGGGARTTPLVRPAIGATAFINGITEFGPGAQIPFHCHNCEESVVLLEGEAYLDIAGEVHELKPGGNDIHSSECPPSLPQPVSCRGHEDSMDLRIRERHAHLDGKRGDPARLRQSTEIDSRAAATRETSMRPRLLEHLLSFTSAAGVLECRPA